MTVVSDTSPPRALSFVGRTDLLGQLFGEILIPPAVRDEIERPQRVAEAAGNAPTPSLRVRAPVDRGRVSAFLTTLHAGESEALALAIEAKASYVLVDDWDARLAARAHGLVATGVLGVLLRAKERRLIAEVRPLIERLREGLDFWVSDTLRDDVLRPAGERVI